MLSRIMICLALFPGLMAQARATIQNLSSKNWRFGTEGKAQLPLYLVHHAHAPGDSAGSLKFRLLPAGESYAGIIGPGSSVTFQVDGDGDGHVGFWLEDHRGTRNPFTLRVATEQAIGVEPVRTYALLLGVLPEALAAGVRPHLELERLNLSGSIFIPVPGPVPPTRSRVETKQREVKTFKCCLPREVKDDKAAWPEPEPAEAGPVPAEEWP